MRYPVRGWLVRLVLAGAVLFGSSSLAAADNWKTRINDDPPTVNVSPVATDGTAALLGGCNKLLGPGFMGTLHNYTGDALQRIDDRREPVIFEITGSSGKTQSFNGHMHYFDEAWVISDALPVSFYAPFARGNTLTIRNRYGTAVVTFDLSGSARAAQTMRRVCGR